MRVLIMNLVTQFTLMSLEVKEVGLKIKVGNIRFIAYSLSVLSHVLEHNDAHAPSQESWIPRV
jgi:hypothetical protein